MKKYNKVIFSLKIFWLMICVLFLYQALSHPKFPSDLEILVLFEIKMQLISMPLGYIFWLLASLFLKLMPVYDFNVYVVLLFRWLLLSSAGYIQWFIVLPKLWLLIKNKYFRH